MNGSLRLTGATLLLMSATLGAMSHHAPQATPQASPPSAAATQSSRAGDQFKNLKVLQDLSASEFNATMHFFRVSLGTTCDHCHDVRNYDADTKPAKATARRMIQMVIDLNKSAFAGRTVVTCNSCHRGSSQPVAIPTVEQGLFPDSTRASVVPPKAQPTPAAILDRYIAAVGGRDALLALRRRTQEGTWSHMALGTAADGSPVAVNRGKVDSFTAATVGIDGLTITRVGFDGTTAIADRAAGKTTISIQGSRGVAQTGTTEQPLSLISIGSQMLNFGLDRELRLAADVATFSAGDSVVLDGREMNVLTRTLQGGVRERFYFGTSDGLLHRRELLRPMLMGEDPIQVDLDDYRVIAGVRVPFTIKTSYLDDNHYGTTVRFRTITHEKP